MRCRLLFSGLLALVLLATLWPSRWLSVHKTCTWVPPPRSRLALRALPDDTPDQDQAGKTRPPADEAWTDLQARADVAKVGQVSDGSLCVRAATLLVDDALDRMRPYAAPGQRYDEPPSPDGLRLLDALNAMLGEDSKYITEFLSDSAEMTPVHEAFWQGELYLERLQKEAGESPAKAALQNIEKQSQSIAGADVAGALENSVLVARQSFVSTVRFAYFLRRCQQRIALERVLRGNAPLSTAEFLKDVDPTLLVELARVATEEAAQAVEQRATGLFGDFRELMKKALRDFRGGPDSVQQTELSVARATQLTLEAAAFGAALFEAEDFAGQRYELHYTAYGSRNQSPSASR